jgi:hypothetical protein
MADLTGFEPATSGLTGRRALQAAPQVPVVEHLPAPGSQSLVAEGWVGGRRENVPVAASRAPSSAPVASGHAQRGPTRAGAFGAIALLPVILVGLYVEVLAAVADSLDDIHSKSHHATGPVWLGMFALLGVAGPAVAVIAAWHTKTERKSTWEATLRAEMAFLLIGIPAALFLIIA